MNMARSPQDYHYSLLRLRIRSIFLRLRLDSVKVVFAVRPAVLGIDFPFRALGLGLLVQGLKSQA